MTLDDLDEAIREAKIPPRGEGRCVVCRAGYSSRQHRVMCKEAVDRDLTTMRGWSRKSKWT